MNRLRQRLYNLLRRTESYFKTDMIYVVRGSFWMTFGQFFTSALSLIVIVAFANLLPKETYGLYRYILSLVGILNIFTLTGMNSAVTRAVASGDSGALRSSVRYQLKWNILMLVGFLGMSAYYFLNNDRNIALSLLVLGLFVPITLALNTYGSYLEGIKEFRIANISNALSSLVYVIGMVLAIVLSGEVIWLVVAYALTTFISTLFIYIYILRKYQPGATSNSDVLKYGRELTFIGFIAPIASQVDKIVLAHFWGSVQLASYSVALAVPDRATIFVKNIVGLGFPKFSTKDQRELNTIFYKRIFQGISFGILSSIVYIALAPYLFRLLLPQYIDSLFYSQILALNLIFAMPNRYVSLLLVSQKMSKVILTNNVIQNIIKIGLYAILGIYGGVVGLVIAYVLNSFISMIINITVWNLSSRSV